MNKRETKTILTLSRNIDLIIGDRRATTKEITQYTDINVTMKKDRAEREDTTVKIEDSCENIKTKSLTTTIIRNIRLFSRRFNNISLRSLLVLSRPWHCALSNKAIVLH